MIPRPHYYLSIILRQFGVLDGVIRQNGGLDGVLRHFRVHVQRERESRFFDVMAKRGVHFFFLPNPNPNPNFWLTLVTLIFGTLTLNFGYLRAWDPTLRAWDPKVRRAPL